MNKIVAILGSPHINGNGAFALDCILKGAKEKGAICLKYELSKINIKNCLGCFVFTFLNIYFTYTNYNISQ